MRRYVLAVEGDRTHEIDLGTSCAYCGGDGKVEVYPDCHECKGRGYIFTNSGRQLCMTCRGEGANTESEPVSALDCGECDGRGVCLTDAGQTLLDFVKKVSK